MPNNLVCNCVNDNSLDYHKYLFTYFLYFHISSDYIFTFWVSPFSTHLSVPLYSVVVEPSSCEAWLLIVQSQTFLRFGSLSSKEVPAIKEIYSDPDIVKPLVAHFSNFLSSRTKLFSKVVIPAYELFGIFCRSVGDNS